MPFVLNPDVDTWAPSCLDKTPGAPGAITSSSGSWHPGTVEPLSLCPWPYVEQLSSSGFKSGRLGLGQPVEMRMGIPSYIYTSH